MMATLKPYTKYNCTACGLYSYWTGVYLEAHRRDTDDHCPSCGALLAEVVDTGDRWRLTWEMVTPPHTGWHPVTKEHTDEFEARQQYKGLLSLIDQGELVRNVKLEHAAMTAWEAVT